MNLIAWTKLARTSVLRLHWTSAYGQELTVA